MMLIAAAADKADFEAKISGSLSYAEVFLIIGMEDTPETARIIRTDFGCSDKEMADMAVEANCEAMISGVLETEAFNILAGAQITRYNGAGLTVFESIKKMQGRSLGCFTRLENEQYNREHKCGHEA